MTQGINRNGVTGLILAGGQSRRMGRDKARLPWGAMTLIEHIIETLRPVVDELIVSVSPAPHDTDIESPDQMRHIGAHHCRLQPSAIGHVRGGVSDVRRWPPLPVLVVEDAVPNAHALGGLYTGLRAASHARCFVCACDAPFLQPRLIRFLIGQADGYDLVVPQTARGIQPLPAVYATSVLPVIEAQLRARQWSLRALALKVRAKRIAPEQLARYDPSGFSLVNLNTPTEYRRARGMTRIMDVGEGRR